MILEVSQANLDLAVQRGRVWEGMELCSDPAYCPIANALRDATGMEWVVDHSYAFSPVTGQYIPLTSEARKLMHSFDHDEPVVPTMLILPSPQSYKEFRDIDQRCIRIPISTVEASVAPVPVVSR